MFVTLSLVFSHRVFVLMPLDDRQAISGDKSEWLHVHCDSFQPFRFGNQGNEKA